MHLFFNIMYISKKMFFELFEKQRPSVKLFYERLENLSPEKKDRYYRYACFLFLNEYVSLNSWNKTFLTNLIKHDLQRFYNYLMETSGFASITCEVKDKEPVVRMFHLLMANEENVKFSFQRISFFVLLSFDINLKVKTLEYYIRDYQFTPETFFELAEYVGIYL